MSRRAFDFLADSMFWSANDQEQGYRAFSDMELLDELRRYREHMLTIEWEASTELAASISARERSLADARTVKRSALYFDQVFLPDPVFALTEDTREGILRPYPEPLPRTTLVEAVRHMKSLLPLVRMGRVRFVPSSLPLEGPPEIPVWYSEDNFVSAVPPMLRRWLLERAEVRKVVADDRGRRLVLCAVPDVETVYLQVAFGQLGRVYGAEHMRIIRVEEEGSLVHTATAPPADEASLAAWVEGSVNKAAVVLLNDVVTDARFAGQLGAAFVTSCEVAAGVLERLQFVEGRSRHTLGFHVELPMVETATVEQLAELIERLAPAFKALRRELHHAGEALAHITDPREFREEAQKVASQLAEEQVHAVERKMHEARRALKWDLPISVLELATGVAGLLMSASRPALGTAALMVGAHGAQTALDLARKQTEHRASPGYFLWRLKKERTSER